MFKRIIVLLSLLFPVLATAQQSMTLEQCLEKARQNNILIVQARQNYLVTEQNVRQYRWANYPTLNFQTNANQRRSYD
jgi:outer membrane protein TolC